MHRSLAVLPILAAGLSLLVGAGAASAGQASTRVVRGTPATIEQAPWQVSIFDNNRSMFCGGSILDPTHILTAAHCATVAEGSGTPRPPADLTVWAGTSNIANGLHGQAAPAGTQVSAVAALRVHPGYPGASTKSDDVAVLTLAKPLDLSTPQARAIALAPVGAGPADGQALRVTGFGQQDPAADASGAFFMAAQTAMSDDDCRDNQGIDSAVILCARDAGGAATCHGDSGSALTTTDANPVVVAVVSYGPTGGCGTGPDGYADVTAPEVRAFIDGAASVPVAPRVTGPAKLSGVNPPVQGSPLVCDPGAWGGAPTYTYTFKTDAVPAEVLQSGPFAIFVPGPTTIGKPIVCVIAATNAGGTATTRSGTAPPIQRDGVRPQSAIRSATCRRRRCTITVQAADANSQGALTLRTTVSYTRMVSCRKHGRRTHCPRTRVRKVNVRRLNATTYRGTITSLPYQRLKISFQVTDAAGNRAPTRARRVTMRRR